MALSKDTVIDKIEVLEDGTLQVRRATYIVEDGERISDPRFHRTVLFPGDDVSQAPARVRAIAQAVWTPAVVAAFQAKPRPPLIGPPPPVVP